MRLMRFTDRKILHESDSHIINPEEHQRLYEYVLLSSQGKINLTRNEIDELLKLLIKNFS